MRNLLLGMAAFGGAVRITQECSDTQSPVSRIINSALFPGDIQRSPELAPVDFGTRTFPNGVSYSARTIFQDCGMDKNGSHYIPHTTFSITMPGGGPNEVLVMCSVKQGKPPNQQILELTSHPVVVLPPGCETIDENALLSQLRESLAAPGQPGSDPTDLARSFATVRPNDVAKIAQQPNKEEVLLALLQYALDHPTPP